MALISGASRGIGAVARRLSRAGWALSLGLREPDLPAGVEAAAVERGRGATNLTLCSEHRPALTTGPVRLSQRP